MGSNHSTINDCYCPIWPAQKDNSQDLLQLPFNPYNARPRSQLGSNQTTLFIHGRGYYQKPNWDGNVTGWRGKMGEIVIWFQPSLK